jgi:hypothetical protein
VALGLGLLCGALPRPIGSLFTDDAALIAELVPFLIALALSLPALQSHFALAGAHRGAGDTTAPFLAAAIGNWGSACPSSRDPGRPPGARDLARRVLPARPLGGFALGSAGHQESQASPIRSPSESL